METFYAIGAVLAAWAVVVSFLGIVRKDFPASGGAEAVVTVVTAVLVVGAIGSAAIGAANQDHGDDDGDHEAALVLPA